MVYCTQYKVAFSTATRRDNVLALLLQNAANNASDFLVPAQIGTYDGAYKFGSEWHFAINASYRFRTEATRDAQWDQAQALLDARAGTGKAVAGAFAELWDSHADDESQDQQRLNYQLITY